MMLLKIKGIKYIEHIGERDNFDLRRKTNKGIYNELHRRCNSAYTADKAEDERDLCYAVNVLGTKHC